MIKFRYAWLLSIALIAGCATMSKLPGCVKLGPYGQICPLPPAALPAVDAGHTVAITHDGERHTFLGRLQIDSDELRLAAFSLFGTHLFTIAYDGRDIVSRPQRQALHADLIVALLEVALADPKALRPRLHGLTLKIIEKENAEVRKLYERGRLAARIEKETGEPLSAARLEIEIPPAKLTLRLKPLENKQ